jgi:CheY-like chemotaxis protein
MGAIFTAIEGQLNRILVIEDSKVYSRALTLCLEEAGYSVACAATGEEGILAARQENPALILLDMHMQRFDGMMVLSMLSGDPKTREIPVLVLSGNPKLEDIAQAKKLGAIGYLVKDAMPAEQLVSAVKALFAGRRKKSALTTIARPARRQSRLQ